MAAPTVEELELLKELRLKVQDIDLDEDLQSDMELLRWIRARENDLVQAELMLRKHTEWRVMNQHDQIKTWELPNDLKGLLPQGFIGYDDDNCPKVNTKNTNAVLHVKSKGGISIVLFASVGKWNPKKVVAGTSREDAIKPHWKMYAEMKERMEGRVMKDGTPVTQIVAIADLNGLSYRQVTPAVLRAFVDLVQGFEANYPEFLKALFVINCPWFVPTFYKVVKPFLSPKTVEKISFHGYNQEEFSEALKKRIPDSALPTIYGGSNADYCVT